MSSNSALLLTRVFVSVIIYSNPNKKEKVIMAYVIGDSCISCGTCEGECPVNAISEGDGKFEINADECISCGTCAGVCPMEAIAEG